MTGGAENAYDSFALAYAESNERNAWNAYYERPAALALVGEVAGRCASSIGCWSPADA